MMRAHIDDRQKIIQNIDKVEDAASRMSDLIRGILNHSNITNSDALFITVDLDKIIFRNENSFVKNNLVSY